MFVPFYSSAGSLSARLYHFKLRQTNCWNFAAFLWFDPSQWPAPELAPRGIGEAAAYRFTRFRAGQKPIGAHGFDFVCSLKRITLQPANEILKRNVGKGRRSGAAAGFDDTSFASNLAERHHSTTFKLANGLKHAMYCA
jgi:hypothetical protein